MTQRNNGIEFDIIIPTFPVQDVVRSTKYYTERLGFEVTYQEGDYFAHIKRGKAVIALYKFSKLQARTGCNEFVPPSKTRATICVEGSDDLFKQCKAKGVTVLNSPVEVPYGWDMQIEDCDGNVVEFVQFKSDQN